MTATDGAFLPSPSRGYAWPPFEPGNTAAVKHGAWSELILEPMADDLTVWLLEVRPDLAEVRHRPAVAAWARCEARILRAETDLVAHGLIDADGGLRPLAAKVGQWERTAAALRAELGLSPKAEADLARVRTEATLSAVDLEAVRERGRAARAARADEPREVSEPSEPPALRDWHHG